MSLNLAAFEGVESPELKITLAADVYDGYRRNRLSYQNCHRALSRLGVPSNAINEGLHTVTTHVVPAVIRSHLV